MTGGRIPKYRNSPSGTPNTPDKGLEGRGQHHIAPPGPKPSKVGPASVGGLEKFEEIDPRVIRGGPKAGRVMHGGHSNTSGNAKPSAQAEARGHHDASGLFAAQKGRNPQRGPGETTKTDRATREKLSTAEGG